MGGRSSGSGFKAGSPSTPTAAAASTPTATRARETASPLSDEALAVIARMRAPWDIYMSWARAYVRSDDDIQVEVDRQAPGATGFSLRSIPDEQGYAIAEPAYELGEPATPVRSVRVRVMRRRSEERRP